LNVDLISHASPSMVPNDFGAVSQGLARKQANRKAREQQRRDRLKDALDRLAHVVPQEYAISFESDSSLSARRGEPTVRDAKVDIVESAIQYITEMKEGRQGKQRQLQQPPPAGDNASKSGTDDEVSVVLNTMAPWSHRFLLLTPTCDIVYLIYPVTGRGLCMAQIQTSPERNEQSNMLWSSQIHRDFGIQAGRLLKHRSIRRDHNMYVLNYHHTPLIPS
jgi:hypothetical protein